ncbi:Uncharacterised protein [Xylophilus ampelinus]|nr:Uncharacterised protein [Xylophilus ampelinus]
MRRMTPAERHIAALKADLERAKLVALAKGRSPDQDDRYVGILLQLQEAEHAARYAKMTSNFGRL